MNHRSTARARRSAWTFATLALCAALATGARPAAAQSAEVEGLIARGVELRDQGNDEAALAQFTRTWELSRSPRPRAQMGLAEQALGRWVDADAHIREALSHADDPWIAAHRAALEQMLGIIAQHLGSLEVRADVPGARVAVNGVAVATLPMAAPVRVRAGRLAIEVRAPGYRTAVLEVDVAPGGLARESVTLVRQAASTTAEAGSAPATRRAAAGVTVRRQDTTGPGTVARTAMPTGRVVAATGFGVAAALAVGAVAANIVREVNAAHWNSASCQDPSRPDQTREDLCRSSIDTAEAVTPVAVGLYIAAGAVAVASVALFAATPNPRPNGARGTHALQIRCAPGAGGAALGVGCVGAF